MKARIVHDPDCESPREADNLGTMALFHRRYNVPNESGMSAEDVARHVGAGFDGVCLPVFMYDHSGLALSTAPFPCPWDSGQLGVVYVDAEKLAKEYGTDWMVNGPVMGSILAVLKGEVATLGFWLNGECYGYVMENGEACFGYYGEEAAEGAAREAGATETGSAVRSPTNRPSIHQARAVRCTALARRGHGPST